MKTSQASPMALLECPNPYSSLQLHKNHPGEGKSWLEKFLQLLQQLGDFCGQSWCLTGWNPCTNPRFWGAASCLGMRLAGAPGWAQEGAGNSRSFSSCKAPGKPGADEFVPAQQLKIRLFCLAWLWGWMLAILIPPCSREQKMPCKIHSESEPHLKELLILLLGTNPKNIPGGKPGSKWMCCSGRRKSCFKGNI